MWSRWAVCGVHIRRLNARTTTECGSEAVFMGSALFPMEFHPLLTYWCHFSASCVFGLYFFLSNLIFRNDNAEMLAVVNFNR